MQQLSEYAVGVSHDNMDAGLVDAVVWCYTPGPDAGDGLYYPIVTSVYSTDLLKYGDCQGILTRGTGSTQCQEIGGGWFCSVAREDMPSAPLGRL